MWSSAARIILHRSPQFKKCGPISASSIFRNYLELVEALKIHSEKKTSSGSITDVCKQSSRKQHISQYEISSISAPSQLSDIHQIQISSLYFYDKFEMSSGTSSLPTQSLVLESTSTQFNISEKISSLPIESKLNLSEAVMRVRALDLSNVPLLPAHHRWTDLPTAEDTENVHVVKLLIEVTPFLSNRLSTLILHSADLRMVVLIAKECQRLKRLELEYTHWSESDHHSTISNNDREAFIPLSDPVFVAVLSRLEVFGLSTCGARRCRLAQTAVFDSLLLGLGENLKVLKLGEYADAIRLCNRCPNVTQFWMLGSVPPFTVNALNTLISSWKFLVLIDYPYYGELTDDMIFTIITTCRNLKHLSLVCVTYDEITDVGINHISTHCKELRSILMHWGSVISEVALVKLIDSNPNLESVQLPRCVSEQIIVKLIAKCRGTLRNLSLEGVSSITANVVSWISRHCSHLEALNVHSARNLNIKWFRAFAELNSVLPRSYKLDIFSPKKEEIEWLRDSLPNAVIGSLEWK
ncbi:hypothetical protein HK096_002963, partial [Nowakowskiella sp. JEL0078]